MTRVEFFFNVTDKLEKVSDLSQKAVAKGRRLMIFTPDVEVSQKLERLLWIQPAIGFLPNCAASNPLAEVTPIVIASDGESLPHDDVLINLQQQYPPFFSRFRRLIEIVGQDETDKAEARNRFRFYRDRGYEIRSFDVNGASL